MRKWIKRKIRGLKKQTPRAINYHGNIIRQHPTIDGIFLGCSAQ